jgi:hypothetical protein
MKKLLKWLDVYILKILVAGLIAFIPLYPKLPSINIQNTWVYIRLEDFLILATVAIWFIQLLRRRVSLFRPIAASISVYWIIGLISLVWSIVYLAPVLPQLFPHVAALSYVRRIEYMILFFVAFSTIRSKSDIRDYFVILSATIVAAFIYGIGQRYYVILWSLFPAINQSQFCFPSFQTGNEEFAKGLALCLPPGGRITSTFGGSYDLAAYAVLVVPVVLGVFLAVKRRLWKIVTGFVFLCGLTLLVLTAQRAAFIAYIVGGVFTLILYKRKKWILPLLLISFSFLFIFNEATAKRFLSTFRVSEVVVDQEGRLIGDATTGEIDPVTKTKRPRSGGDLPEGSAFLGLPQDNLRATDSAVIERTLAPEEARRLRLESGSIQVSTVSGSFLVRKVLVYDISFTTRFQAEWPNAWRAFQRNPLLGSGYSSITLATDNDYFRALGETGLLGFLSFFGIFVMLWVVFRKLVPLSVPSLAAGFSYGLAGGVVGLLLNATLIDVFEASKVAESLWLLTGIAVGSLVLYQKKKISYGMELLKTLSSNVAFIFYLLLITLFVFVPSLNNFFVADDFTWLRWAANDSMGTLTRHFVDAQGFFYRPLDKIITYFLYTVFSFQPQGYHFFIIVLHFIAMIGVYIFSKQILKNSLLAFMAALLFAIHPAKAENVFWFSGLSGVLSSVFILYATVLFHRFKEKKSVFSYGLVLAFSVLAFMSYELAIAAPLLFLAIDFFIFKTNKVKSYIVHLPFILLVPLYYLVRLWANSFQSGGDYTYNFAKIIQNVTGNFFGYVGMFLAGDYFIHFYNALRDVAREQSGVVGVLLIVVIGFVSWLTSKNKTKIAKAIKNSNLRTILFGLVFAFAALVPFLPLGNIAPRYLYLSSVGFSISLVALLSVLLTKLLGKKAAIKNVVFLTIVTALSIFYVLQLVQSRGNWEDAGFVTKNTLYFFRTNHPGLKSTDTIHIVNNPVTYKGAWTFPTGIGDGLWFVYLDELPKINYADSVDDARGDIRKSGSTRNLIFKFDEFGDIREVR